MSLYITAEYNKSKLMKIDDFDHCSSGFYRTIYEQVNFALIYNYTA